MVVVTVDSSICGRYHSDCSNDAQVDYQEVDCLVKGMPVLVIAVIVILVINTATTATFLGPRTPVLGICSLGRTQITPHYMRTNICCHLVGVQAPYNCCQLEKFKVLFHCYFVPCAPPQLSINIIFFRPIYISCILFHFMIHIH